MPSTSCNHNQVTAVVLAGGAGRRMAGQDKGLMPLRGKPLILHVLERLGPQADCLLINSNRNQESYAAFGYPLVKDTMSGGLGPLAGLLSAMEYSDSEFVLSAPCDTPNLPRDLIPRMLSALEKEAADACTVSDGERLHPVIMLVRARLAPELRRYLESGKRKVHDWYYSTKHCSTDFSDNPQAFININTPDQLREAEQE
ncbi:MAG: molybdenum cofactor guanylyltransferase MobA [Pseudomonadota bacterium]